MALCLIIPLKDDYGQSMTLHLEAIESANDNELLNQLKQYLPDERFKKDLKALMSNAIRSEWNNLVLESRLTEQREAEEET